jgi:hypothetical protein
MTKVDLDELERRIRTDHNARLTRAQSLALIARIRELEEALNRYGDCEYDEATTNILDRGVVLP